MRVISISLRGRPRCPWRCSSRPARSSPTGSASGMSVMEVSHRGKAFLAVARETESDLRELLAVPANYRVLFLQGGAAAQFAACRSTSPRARRPSITSVTGALVEAGDRRGAALVAARQRRGGRGRLELHHGAGAPRRCRLTPGAAYVHYTAERDHRRGRVPLRARDRRGAARGRHVLDHPVAPDRRRDRSG